MSHSKLNLQQQQQLLNAACLAVLSSPLDTLYPVRFDPFEHFVSKAQNFSDNLVYLVLTLVFAWSTLFFSLKSSILLVAALLMVKLYSLHGAFAIRDAAHWYWYECTDFQNKVHESNHVSSVKTNDKCCYCSTLGVEDDAGFIGSLNGSYRYSSLEGEDTGAINSKGNNHCYCSSLEGEDAGGIDPNNCCSSLVGEDAVSTVVKGDDDIVGVDNSHLPGDADLRRDDHGANDINPPVAGGLGSVDTNLLVKNTDIYGNMNNPVIFENLFLSPIEKKVVVVDDNTVSVFYPPLAVVEKECGGSNTSFYYFKNSRSQDSAVLRSRLRVRRFIRSLPGALRCERIRPLRFSGDSSFRFSSSLVGSQGVDSFDKLALMEADINTCEPMEIDSFEANSVVGDDQELVVGSNFGSFSFGYVPTLKEGSFEPVVTDAGSSVNSIPLPPPSCGVFLKESVSSDFTPVVTGAKFETSVSDERGHAVFPEPPIIVQETIVVTKEEPPASLVTSTSISTTRLLVEDSSGYRQAKPSPLPRAMIEDPFGSKSIKSRPLVEDPFGSKPVRPRPLVEDPFGSKPVRPMASSSSSSSTTKDQYHKAIWASLFEESDEEEEEIKPALIEKKEEKPSKKDDRKMIKPKSRTVR